MHGNVGDKIEDDEHFAFNQFDIPEYRERYPRLFQMWHPHIQLDRLEGKRVIDLACGYGWHGLSLKPYKPDVLYVDGRQAHLDAVKREDPTAATHVMNVEYDKFPIGLRADLVLCMGIIYHIYDPRELFNKIAAISDRIIVDSTVCDHDKEYISWHRENNVAQGFSITGWACRPSPKWVERNLAEAGFPFVFDISDKCGNIEASPGICGYLYDWEYRREVGHRRNEQALRKMYLASRNWPDELLK